MAAHITIPHLSPLYSQQHPILRNKKNLMLTLARPNIKGFVNGSAEHAWCLTLAPLAKVSPKHRHALMQIFLEWGKVWMIEDCEKFHGWYTPYSSAEVNLGMLWPRRRHVNWCVYWARLETLSFFSFFTLLKQAWPLNTQPFAQIDLRQTV